MLLFLYEYTCALADPTLPPSLCAEGRAMLSAAAADFAQVPGVATCTLLPACCVWEPGPCRSHTHDGAEEIAFRRLAARADYTLVIAPEFDDLLLTRCRWVLEAGGRLLGPQPEAVRLTADKLALADHLRRHGIPSPSTTGAGPAGTTSEAETVTFPAVCKPRFGAGSQATFLVRVAADLPECLALARREAAGWEMVLQPHLDGRPASVAVLAGPGGVRPLLPAEQHLSGDGRFRYLGGALPLPSHLCSRARRLAAAAVTAVPGLCGYAGVDLVLGDAPDGSRDGVIEINPRLTTSYVGLRRLASFNLAAALLRSVRGEPLAQLTWQPGSVRFRADGSTLPGRDEG
jgi:predicted ATP-grasp superfamily ATP-dependent carboligase